MQVAVADKAVEASFNVAIPAALIATKLHALVDRHDVAKKASDARDLMRLLPVVANSDGIAPLLAAPLLAQTVAEVAHEHLVRNAERVMRYVQVYEEAAAREFDVDDIRIQAGAFLRLIS
jgi:hypothetical protein